MTDRKTSWRHVLVVVDEDGQSKLPELAETLRKVSDAEWTALAVVEPLREAGRLRRMLGPPAGELDALRREALDTRLAPWRATPTMNVVVREGRPLVEVVRMVQEGPYDLVLKSADVHRDGGARFLGSLDQHLLRKCPAPVWLHRPPAPGPTGSVLAAVDVDLDAAADPAALDALNRSILAQARSVALSLGAALHVVHVWDAPAEQLLTRWSPGRETVERYVADVEAECWRRLGALIDGTKRDAPLAIDIRPHLRRGDPRDEIPALAELLGARLVVLGTVARAGIPGLLIGNTAEDLIHSLDTALLAIKPADFVSPIDPAAPRGA
ncbi:MAG: universal stress protein [Pseudomonadales bacterium]|jgi:nucleotide-binding universal stress UspA family protein|nr:universal stress protein [Pseudomonadales bacterium]